MLALVCLGECVRNCDLVGVGRPVGPARGAVAVHQLAQSFGRDGVDRVKHDANVRINGNKQLNLHLLVDSKYYVSQHIQLSFQKFSLILS